MTREGALLITVAVTVVLLALMVWAWRRKARRDATPLSEMYELPEGSQLGDVFDGQYVATTRTGEPMQRIAAPGLGFISSATISVADTGVVLDLVGQRRVVIPADRIDEVAQATVAIDRIVETDGLVRLTWRTDSGSVVDTYLRAKDAPASALADSIHALIQNPRTGSHA
ncbi:PH-like domain-containing protein [Microbacterium terrisoli]|uniref:PH-like domain-containing protein n=1 Tax=Microbacterium terrisoli TaxID=3242192 RepID=UPI0028056A22|nr:hypothetical protein [Microbacterium protaetiae]